MCCVGVLRKSSRVRVTGVVVVARGCKVGKGAAKAGKKFKKTPKKFER